MLLSTVLVTLGAGIIGCKSKGTSSDGAHLREAASSGDLVALRAQLAKKPSQDDLTEALVGASGHGKLDAVRELLAAGASPARASVEKGGIKPLLLASYGGHAAVVDELLARGAPVESENADRETALMVCGSCAPAALRDCEHGCAQITKALLAAGANPNARDKHGRAVIGAQALVGNPEVLEQLIAKGAKVEVPDGDGQTPLFEAASNGSAPAVRLLLAQHAVVDAKNKFGATPLVAASDKGHTACVEELLRAGASVAVRTDADQLTPLMVAANGGHAPIVEALLHAKAPAEARSKRGQTALHIAAASEIDRAEVVKLLLANGAAKDAVVDSDDALNGISALGLAAMRGSVGTVTALLDAGATMTLGPPRTAPPLAYAAVTGKLDIVKLLVERGAPIDQTNPQGGTPLRSAADTGHIEVVRFLLSKGANARHKDSFGKLPVDYAREKGHSEIVTLLEKAP